MTHAEPAHFQPMQANPGLLPALEPPIRNRQKRFQAHTERALQESTRF